MRIWVSLLIASTVSVATACTTANTPAAATARPAPASPVPAVALTRLDGTRVPLAELAAGRPTLVTLWATWCEACRSEFAPLSRLWLRAGRDALIVAVDEGENAETVQSFVANEHLPYPQLVDEAYALGDALGERRVPTTLVIDRDGMIVYRGGVFDSAALAALRAELER